MIDFGDVQAVSPAVSAVSMDQAACILRRAVEDALSASTPGFWRRRAEVFEWARPRPGDFIGRAAEAELAARDARLAGMAEACRRHAELVEGVRPWWLDAAMSDALAEWVAA